MRVIGLTGGILSGKSTIAQMLAEKGAVIVDADRVGHEAYQPHTQVWQEVVAAFGPAIVKENEEIDRKRLGEVVFKDPAALERLNRIMHPRMHDMIGERIERLRRDGAQVVVLEAAVLIEASWTDLVDEVWVATAPEETVVARLKDRGGMSEEQARARIRSQLSPEERARHGDVIIDTDCDLSGVRATVDQLWQRLQSHGDKGV